MKELIRIELKKMSLNEQLRALVIANIVLLLVMAMPLFMIASDGMGEVYLLMSLAIIGTFMVWQSILLSSLVVEEFKTKTMMQLYTYPVKRSAVIISKVGLIMMMMLVFTLVTHFVQHSLFAGFALLIPGFSYTLSLSSMLRIVVMTIATVMMAMMTLTVGLWMKSTVAPVVTSFALMTVLSNVNGFSLANNLIFMVMMGALGTACTVFSIIDVLKKDLIV